MKVPGKVFAFAILAAFGVGGVLGALAMWPRDPDRAASSMRPVWTEVKWPFPVDQWGRGRAFECTARDCGAHVAVYLRPKLGACNCTTGVADDVELERMSDFEFVGGGISPLGEGRVITVASMKGRSRAYALTAPQRPGKTAISAAFNDRCDMVVATAVLPHERPAAVEPTSSIF